MEQKICIVCGKENYSRSKRFCSEKCHQEWYYNQNKEKILERHRKWNKDNHESYKKYHKEYHVKYYQENKERILEHSKEYGRKYRQRMKEKRNDQVREENN